MKKLILSLVFIPSVSMGAEITITIPPQHEARVYNALADRFNWTPERNPDKRKFVNGQIKQIIKELVANHEANKAGREAKRNAYEKSKNEIDIE